MSEQRTRPDLGTYDDIANAAMRSTGLSDFGGNDHEEGLRILCEDMAAHGGLTPVGNFLQRAQIKSALVSRLVAEQGFKDNPTYRDVPIQRPIFVTGLPRTGTSITHELGAGRLAFSGARNRVTNRLRLCDAGSTRDRRPGTPGDS